MNSHLFRINKTTFHTEHTKTDFDHIDTSKALGTLRTELIETIGLKKAKPLLFNYGRQLGETIAQKMLDKHLSIKELLNQGPLLHCKAGHINGSIFEGLIEFDEDESIQKIDVKGTWIQSFEASEHLNSFGSSEETVCHTLAGFASGYMSTICKFKVEVVEKSCFACGDENCTWEIASVQPLLLAISKHEDDKIFDLAELNTIQNNMIQMIMNGATIDEVLKHAGQLFQRTFILEDIFYNFAYSAGLHEHEKQLIQQNVKGYDEKERKQLGENFFEKRQQLVFTKKLIQLNDHARLTNTVVINNKVVGFLSMVSLTSKSFTVNDFSILTKMTSVISVLLMSHLIKTNSSEADEYQFTQNLITKNYSSYEEVLTKSRFFNIDINELYTVAILRWKTDIQSIHKAIEQYIRNHLKKYQLLLTNQGNDIVILLLHRLDNEEYIELVFQNLISVLHKQFTGHSVQIGYSAIGHNILEANSHFQEASLALFSKPDTFVSAFKDISILSIFINNDLNKEHVKQIAKDKFSQVLLLKEQRRKELLQTLYVYLNNNLKIETTMRILNISKSGLLYRLATIKDYIDSDLKDPNENFQLLLLLKAVEISSNAKSLEELDLNIDI